MKLLYLGGFNNYFNRIIKKLSTIEEYKTAVGDNYRIRNSDLNPNDGVSTKMIVDWMDTEDSANTNINFVPDYVVVHDESNNIVSRWFITEFVRTRGGQYNATLKRDVIADHINEIIASKAYIQKGTITDIESPFIYNSENFSCNQIKKKEVKIFDQSGCPWLVLYLKKGTLNADAEDSEVITITNNNSGIIAKEIDSTIEDWSYYDYSTHGTKTFDVVRGQLRLYTFAKHGILAREFKIYDNGLGEWSYMNNTSSSLTCPSGDYNSIINALMAAYISDGTVFNSAKTALGLHDSLAQLEEQTGIIKASDGKYYEVNISIASTANVSGGPFTSTEHPALFAKMNSLWNTAVGEAQTANDSSFAFTFDDVTRYQLVISERKDLNCTAKLNEIKRKTDSSLYDIVAMPYGNIDLDSGHGIPMNPVNAKLIMDQIAQQFGGNENVLDYQLIPYCPLARQCSSYLIPPFGDQNDTYVGITNHDLYWEFKQGGNAVARVYLVEQTNFTFNKTVTIGLLSEKHDTVKKLKYLNDCQIIRLCSPNYCGLYEFNLAKNGIKRNYFQVNVDITLKPYQPYIHVNPIFGNLYGQDFDDARGLICGGDFSLGMVNDAWIRYQYENKNYRASFDRDIQSLDIQQRIQKQEAIFNVGAGAIGAGAAGAVTGAKLGGGYGAIAGAAIGAGAGILGGAMDMNNLSIMQKEQRDLAIDKFNMSLQNVQALPITINKVDALTANNKLVPFIEVYECTEQEKEAYMNKLDFEGMTIGIIDTIANWTNLDYTRFIKASLIRCTNIMEDSHLLNEINLELEKGVYL